MNPKIKEMARESAHMARTAANETKDNAIRELALAVFGLAMAVERIADLLPEKPKKEMPHVPSGIHSMSASSARKRTKV
ncbi:MAG TPA: hypothetical protein VFE51_05275 [Verrucomicrobiae bacterium]|nr:hypothetical protein [Verrucomicrobiae bacterium]